MNHGVLYVQNRTHRAGAQTCLARLFAQPEIRKWNPSLVCSRPGWLTRKCDELNIPVVIEEFPSSRSFSARLVGNHMFAARVAAQLHNRGIKPAIVHANDHLEGLLGLNLATALHAAPAIFLRSPRTTRDDFFKYKCDRYRFIASVGEELQQVAATWHPSGPIQWIPDGIDPSEFLDPKPKSPQFPQRILVIGSPLDWKGWADLAAALYLLQQEDALPSLQFDFTGDQPDPARNDLKLERIAFCQFNFLGHTETFRELVRQYDLVINPSWHETFGMAAVEVLAAGVPLLSSRTGVMEHVQENPAFLFIPRNPSDLAEKLSTLFNSWHAANPGLHSCQENIRNNFLVDHAANKIVAQYENLVNPPA